MSLAKIDVTMINGETATWHISKNLGDIYALPRERMQTDPESVKLIKSDPMLMAILRSMLVPEVSDNATVALKDGVFGVLYYRHFDCAESDIGSRKAAPNRGRVIRRILADISSELSLNPRFPNGIDIAIPPPSTETHHQVALWIFVPHTLFVEEGNWDVLDDVVSLLME